MSLGKTTLTTGQNGRVKIDAAGTDTYTGSFFCIKPISSDFTYGAGCVATHGDAPDSGDAVLQGDLDQWPGSVVVAGTGSAWVYTSNPS